jgi:aspartyl-tRNA(Asn)/glutamyl-tRNA(Gln) amidotransferase subunit B
MDDIKLVIGLEMHCELKSNSKVFSTAPNAFSEDANIHVSPVDMAFPGILPLVNKYNVEEAIKMASILHCTIADTLIFDRKNYFYPDLPKGYQITQFHQPMGVEGYIDYEVNQEIKRAYIFDLHLEEDAAALDHFTTTSTIDYNRCGVPLIEIVTKPCFYSADEAIAFLENMRNIYKYTNISDADTKRGQIRCDVNVNLKNIKTNKYVTPRVEMKNVNSFANVSAAIKYEYDRQLKAYLKDGGQELTQETRRFDEEKGITVRMRSKVDAVDYKYFIEPNIPEYPITKDWIEKITKDIPELPLTRKLKYLKDYHLTEEESNTLIKERSTADYFEKCVKIGINPKLAVNWINGSIQAELNKTNLDINDFYLTPEYLKEIIAAITNGLISSKQAKDIFNEVITQKKAPRNFINLNQQLSDEAELSKIIDTIINNNLKQKEAYLNGRSNLFDFFVGQVMKETKGKANPVITKELLHNKLEK